MSLLDLSLDHQRFVVRYLGLQDIHTIQQVCKLLYKQTWKYAVTSMCFKSGSTDLTVVEYTRRAPHILSLNLSGTGVTDTGMKSLEVLINLSSLNLSDTKVTDTGMKSLEVLTNLSNFNLSLTNVTDTGMESLQVLLNLI
jgi:hypothetical protein